GVQRTTPRTYIMEVLILRRRDHCAGAPPALSEVYRHNVGFVARALRRLGVADEHLDDVVHDVFLIVHRRLGDYDGRAPLRSWLYGIARGVAANYRRGQLRAQRRLQLIYSEPTGPL